MISYYPQIDWKVSGDKIHYMAETLVRIKRGSGKWRVVLHKQSYMLNPTLARTLEPANAEAIGKFHCMQSLMHDAHMTYHLWKISKGMYDGMGGEKFDPNPIDTCQDSEAKRLSDRYAHFLNPKEW